MDVRLPKLGEGAESGTVVAVAVKEGDTIAKGQTILELENEKAVAPIPSTVSGTVTSVRVKEGDKLSVGQVMVTVAEVSEPRSQPPATGQKMEIPKPQGSKEIPASEEPETSAQPEPARTSLPPAASPSIRKMARELGIDLSRIRGSEDGGRIVMADLRAYLQQLERLAAQPKAPAKSKPQAPAPERIDFSRWGRLPPNHFRRSARSSSSA